MYERFNLISFISDVFAGNLWHREDVYLTRSKNVQYE